VVKLGDSVDVLLLTASTYAKTDTVEGLNLIAGAEDGLDELSDIIIVGGINMPVDAIDMPDVDREVGFVKFTTEHTDLDLALKDAAASDLGNNLVFQLGGDTYIYMDSNDDDLLNDNDGLVKLVGNIDLDLLVDSLDGFLV